jgi:EAL domain-containing protein (putative c-di-GMP-specific phosphodiesterase class I)
MLHYQPIVELSGGALVGYEALVRWRHPTRGLLVAADFIPLAEETGLIVPLGRWVLGEACRRARIWQDEFPSDPPRYVSVNLSPRQLQHASLVDDVADALARNALPPSMLVLEVVESQLMQDPDAAIAQLEALKGLGVALAVDDFGTGYSSLSHLQRLPVDLLKIDKTFVQDMRGGREAAELAREIVRLGSLMNLRTIAEGVELDEQLHSLRDLQCDLGQGYYFARPLSEADMTSLLAQGDVRLAEPEVQSVPSMRGDR